MNLQTLKAEKEKVEKEIKEIKGLMHFNYKCPKCNSRFTTTKDCEVHSIVNKHHGDYNNKIKINEYGKENTLIIIQARLEALNLGIQAVENTIKDVLMIINKEIHSLEANGGNNKGNIWNIAYNRLLSVKSQLQKQTSEGTR